MKSVLYTVSSVLLLGGCASMMDGSSQTIHVETTPANATCTVRQDSGAHVTTFRAPGSFTVPKTWHDLEIVCTKEGVGHAHLVIESGTDAWTFGNVVTGGSTAVIDWGTGALHKYPAHISLALVP